MADEPTIKGNDPNRVTLDVMMAPGQVAPGFRLTDSAGNVKASIDKEGTVLGTVDEIRYTNAYASLQTAINAVCPTVPLVYDDSFLYTDGGVLFHPDIEWTFADSELETSVVVPTNLTLVGTGSIKSKLNWHGDTGTDPALGLQCRRVSYGAVIPILNVSIRDLALFGDWHTAKTCIEGIGSSFDYSPPAGDYYKEGFGINITGNTIQEWGVNGITIIGSGPVPWYGKLTLDRNNFYACKRWGLQVGGDIRVLDLSASYFGPESVITDHDLGTIENKGGYGGVYAAQLWNADFQNVTVEMMTETYLGDYSHSIWIEGGLGLNLFNIYEEGNTFGTMLRSINGLHIMGLYHQANEGIILEDCAGIVEHNRFNFMNENATSFNILIDGTTTGLTVRDNYILSVITKAAGVRFSSDFTGVPDFVQQMYSSLGNLDAEGNAIMGKFVPMQTRADAPEDADYGWLKWDGVDSYDLQTPQIGLQVYNTADDLIYVRTAAGWYTLTPVAP